MYGMSTVALSVLFFITEGDVGVRRGQLSEDFGSIAGAARPVGLKKWSKGYSKG